VFSLCRFSNLIKHYIPRYYHDATNSGPTPAVRNWHFCWAKNTPPPNFGNNCQPLVRHHTFFKNNCVKILQFYKRQSFTILLVPKFYNSTSVKILQFYKCQNFTILQASKFYNSTSAKILQFSSYAHPQSKCLLLLKIYPLKTFPTYTRRAHFRSGVRTYSKRNELFVFCLPVTKYLDSKINCSGDVTYFGQVPSVSIFPHWCQLQLQLRWRHLSNMYLHM
jgi:hypothetical protein